jgi:hypothetical protein
MRLRVAGLVIYADSLGTRTVELKMMFVVTSAYHEVVSVACSIAYAKQPPQALWRCFQESSANNGVVVSGVWFDLPSASALMNISPTSF